MSKLFSTEEELVPGRITREGIEIEPSELELDTTISDHEDYMALAAESFSYLTKSLSDINTMQTSLFDKPIGSKSYLYTVENYRGLLESAASNMGVRTLLPTMEDYSSSFAARGCHQVTMEGIKDTIKKIWEKIKSFFSAIWKKITDFVKRITKMNMDVDMYDRYIEDYIRKIKNKDLKPSDSIKTVKTKLPSFLTPRDVADYKSSSVYEDFKNITDNLKNLTTKTLPECFKAINDTIKSQQAVLKNIETGIPSSIKGTFVEVTGLRKTLADAVNASTSANSGLVGPIIKNIVKGGTSNPEVMELFSNVEGGIDDVYSLVSDDLQQERLPKGFNIYLVVQERSIEDIIAPGEGEVINIKIIGVAKTTQEVDGINNELEPIKFK